VYSSGPSVMDVLPVGVTVVQVDPPIRTPTVGFVSRRGITRIG
jgi:hypothetical protein